MKAFLLFAILIFQTYAFALTTCLDISGDYLAPWNTSESETKFVYRQTNCDFLLINGRIISQQPPSAASENIQIERII